MNTNPIYLVKDTEFKTFVITEFPSGGDLIVKVAYLAYPSKLGVEQQCAEIVSALNDELKTNHGMSKVHVASQWFKTVRPNESFSL